MGIDCRDPDLLLVAADELEKLQSAAELTRLHSAEMVKRHMDYLHDNYDINLLRSESRDILTAALTDGGK